MAPSLPCQTTSASATAPVAASRTVIRLGLGLAVDERDAGDVPRAGPPTEVSQLGLDVGPRERPRGR